MLKTNPKIVVMERSLMEYFEIFVVNMFKTNLMTLEEYDTYKEIYWDKIQRVGHPNVVLLLEANMDTLVNRIRKRNRIDDEDLF